MIYFFSVDGTFQPTAEAARVATFDFTSKYAYYAKVELLVPGIADPEKAALVAQDFLSQMMPEIMAVLPDWNKVQAGEWPPPNE